jgi:transposase
MAEPITPDYEQTFLLPPALEEWVERDHPVRFVREFVDALDLEELGFKMPECADGRPPYAPSLMVKIWLYGYVQRIRSTRQLERACRDHLSLLWLCGMYQPDHNSLWRFWRANQVALRGIFRQTVRVAVRSGYVGLAVQALDGTKIAAAGSSHTGWSQERMEKLLAGLDEALATNELEVLRQNADDDSTPGYRLPAGLTERQQLREQINRGLAQLAADGRHHYHPVEPDARRMKTGEGNRYAYNAQAVTDAQAGIITAAEVTRQETDVGQLVPMIVQAQENIGVAATKTETLADTGYGAGADLQAAAALNVSVLVPPAAGSPPKHNPYASQHFHYNEISHTVTCPQQRTLQHEGATAHHGRPVERYRCHHHDCPVRTLCSQDPKGRQIEVHPHTPAVQVMRERLREPATQARYRRRAGIAEPSFARIKQHDAFRRFTVWGFEAVRTQWSMICAAANLRILFNHWKKAFLPPRPAAGVPATATAAA